MRSAAEIREHGGSIGVPGGPVTVLQSVATHWRLALRNDRDARIHVEGALIRLRMGQPERASIEFGWAKKPLHESRWHLAQMVQQLVFWANGADE